MTTATRRGIVAVVTAIALLACGIGLGVVTGATAVGEQFTVGGAERDMTMAWLARLLLALAVAWVVIGVLSARTRLVRRPGAAAARASWIASTRPWRARESTLGMLDFDRWLLLLVPAALLVATRVVQTSFLSWVHVAVVLGAWLAFAAALRVCIGRRSPWPVIAAVGGVVMLRCIVTLAVLSVGGPSLYWQALWREPAAHTVYITVAFALFAWVFVAAGWALSAQVGTRRAVGYVLAGVGGGLAVPAAVIGAIGLETVLADASDETGLLPWGLLRVLGITTSPELSIQAPWYAAAMGAAMLVAGMLLTLPWRTRGAPASRP